MREMEEAVREEEERIIMAEKSDEYIVRIRQTREKYAIVGR